jgi:hypothetical protein
MKNFIVLFSFLLTSQAWAGTSSTCVCNPFPANRQAVGLFLESENSVTQLRLFWLNDYSELDEMIRSCETTRQKLVEFGICSKDGQSNPSMDMSATGGSCSQAKSTAVTQCHRSGFLNYAEDHCTPEQYWDMTNQDAVSVGKCI